MANAQDLIQRVAVPAWANRSHIGFLRDVNGKFDKKSVDVACSERPSSSTREWMDSKAAPKDVPPKETLFASDHIADMTPQ